MIFYRVKQEYDNTPQTKSKRWLRIHCDIWIGNELYTGCELDRMEKRGIMIPEQIFEKVEIKKTETYFFFGARFEMEE